MPLRLELLFYPFTQLHALLEKEETRLCDVFPNVLRALRTLFYLADEEVFSDEYLYIIRILITSIYESFLHGERENMLALAYFLTPDGRRRYQAGRFASVYSHLAMEAKSTESAKMPPTDQTVPEAPSQPTIICSRCHSRIPCATFCFHFSKCAGGKPQELPDSDSDCSSNEGPSVMELANESRLKRMFREAPWLTHPDQTSLGGSTPNTQQSTTTSSSSSSSSSASSRKELTPPQNDQQPFSTLTEEELCIPTEEELFSIPFMQRALVLLEWHPSQPITDRITINTFYTSKTDDMYDENVTKLLKLIKDIELEELVINVSATGDIVYPETIRRNEDDEDDLGLLEAAEASEDDEFQYSEDSHTSSSSTAAPSVTTTSGNSGSPPSSIIISSPDQPENLRSIRTRSETQTTTAGTQHLDASGKPLSVYLQQPDELGQSEADEERDQLANVLLYPNYDSKKERSYFSSLAQLIQTGWKERLIEGYRNYALYTQADLSVATRDKLDGLFLSFFQQPVGLSVVSNSFTWYADFAMSSLHSLFAYCALSLIQSPASESSCERIFSQCKWIVGDRRKHMKLSTVAMLLHVLGK